MTHGDLSPYQKQNAYYMGVNLGKDLRNQAVIINNSTKELIKTQIASTNSIVVSQKRINEGIDIISCGIERVEQGIFGLQAAFEWGISEVVWQLEQNCELLKSIEEGIWSPFDAQAINRKRQAQKNYRYGWIDEAEEYFMESEKIVKTDFSVHISLGMIYLFHKIDKNKALQYFEKAIKYSEPESPFHCSYSLLYKALIKFDFGDLIEAEKSTSDAILLNPNFSEALYQNAQYNAQLKKIKKAITNLKKAILLDKNYCIKADNDEMFDPIRDDVINLFKSLRNETKKRCDQILEELRSSVQNINEIMKKTEFPLNNFNAEFTEIDNIISRNSYFDCLDGLLRMNVLISLCKVYVGNSEKYLENEIKIFDSEINDRKTKFKERKDKTRDNLRAIFSIAGFLLVLFPSLKGCSLYLDSTNISNTHFDIIKLFFDLVFFALLPFLVFLLILGIGFTVGHKVGIAISKIILSRRKISKKLDQICNKKGTFENYLYKIKSIRINLELR